MEKNNSSKGKEKESERIISIPKGKRQFDAALFGATIQKGFSKLHKDEKTSDIILLVGEEKIPTHRMVICAWSDTFRGMLETGSWQESNEKELKINIEEEDYAVFKLLIEYMYTGNADFVDDDNVIPLISLTNYYGIHSLKEVCGKLLGEQINDGNIQFLLDLVDKYDCKELEKKCGEYLASNFEDMWADDQTKILSLRPDTWAAMLQSDDLTISSEQLLFEILQEYAKQFDNNKEGGETRASVLDKLLPHVRYSFISTKYLTERVESNEELMSHPLLQRILFENYRYKAYTKSQPKLFTTRMRTASQRFDENHKAPGFTITEDGTKATSSGGGWQSIRVECPFSDSYVYCEFKCESVVNVMVGVVVGDSVPLTGYIGQYTNGYCVHNSDGSFFYNGSSVSKGLTYATGDVIGVSYVPSQGLSFYKNGSKIFSHPLSTTSAQTDIYAALSATTGSSVSVVPRPCLPDDLVEHARGKQRKRRETDTKPAAPTQAATGGFSFGSPSIFGTPAAPSFGSSSFSF